MSLSSSSHAVRSDCSKAARSRLSISPASRLPRARRRPRLAAVDHWLPMLAALPVAPFMVFGGAIAARSQRIRAPLHLCPSSTARSDGRRRMRRSCVARASYKLPLGHRDHFQCCRLTIAGRKTVCVPGRPAAWAAVGAQFEPEGVSWDCGSIYGPRPTAHRTRDTGPLSCLAAASRGRHSSDVPALPSRTCGRESGSRAKTGRRGCAGRCVHLTDELTGEFGLAWICSNQESRALFREALRAADPLPDGEPR